MKNLLIIITTALFSSFFSFLIFKHTLMTDSIASPTTVSESARNVKLVNNEISPMNTSPTRIIDVPGDFVDVASKVTSAVVYIKTFGTNGYSSSSGSGVVASADGYIITNKHVIDNGEKIQVFFNDKSVATARLIGSDPTTDLAVLKVEERGLTAINYGDSDAVRVGEWVLAVGNPFNLESTVTAGIVSAKGRNIDILRGEYSIESFIQTDAVVNPGNSGGALVNSRGELVGINSAILSQGGSYEGYSFAIPSDLVEKVVRDLVEYGSVQRAVLGVSIRNVNNILAKDLGLDKPKGVFIESVRSNSSAEGAGIIAGDVVMKINGVVINSVAELQEEVAQYRPGAQIDISLLRNGRMIEKNNVVLKKLRS